MQVLASNYSSLGFLLVGIECPQLEEGSYCARAVQVSGEAGWSAALLLGNALCGLEKWDPASVNTHI